MPLAIKHTSHFIFEIMLIRHTRVCHRSISVKLLLYALFLAIDEFTLKNASYRKFAECLVFPIPLLTKLTSITETNRAAYGAGSLI